MSIIPCFTSESWEHFCHVISYIIQHYLSAWGNELNNVIFLALHTCMHLGTLAWSIRDLNLLPSRYQAKSLFYYRLHTQEQRKDSLYCMWNSKPLSLSLFCFMAYTLLCIQFRLQHLDHLKNGGTYTHYHAAFKYSGKRCDAFLHYSKWV